MVHRFQELICQTEIEANWLLTAQRRVMPMAVPISLKIVPYARRQASIKHFQIADTIFEKRQLALKTDNQSITDILYTRQENNEVVLLEAGFANLLLLKPNEKRAISPDPNVNECLSGVEIRRVIDELTKADWQIQWGQISTQDLTKDCYLFLTNAVQGVVPVKAIYPEVGLKPGELKPIWECDVIKTYTELVALP
jgi:branched-subunit amino acid aminotransferase/4-amino-4-deoxychorismate lyase